MAFDPSLLVRLAIEQAGDVPSLPAGLARCTEAAWRCSAYAQFARDLPDGSAVSSAILESADEDFVIDLDRDGVPLGVELLRVASDHDHG